jgi:hypothetical protein
LFLEFLNFYPMGACHSQPEGRRYTHTVWKGRDSVWRSFPHNGIYTCQVAAPYRVKYLDLKCGQVGYGANPVFNPLLTVMEAKPGLELHTCSMWRDEHFVIQPGGLEDREGGFYHTSARVKLENISQEAMQKLMDEAKPVSISEDDSARCQFPEFTIGKLCDFEEAAPVDEPGHHSFWEHGGEQPQLAWLEEGGRNGGRCLGVTASPFAQAEVRAFPVGANPHPGAGRKCRLTAWVDTTNLAGEAWIALARYEYQVYYVTARAMSPRCPGGKGWTELKVEFDTGDQQLLMPELWVQGDGQAKFDDVLMEILETNQ